MIYISIIIYFIKTKNRIMTFSIFQEISQCVNPQETLVFKIYTKHRYNNSDYDEKMYYITILQTRLFTDFNYCCYFDFVKYPWATAS